MLTATASLWLFYILTVLANTDTSSTFQRFYEKCHPHSKKCHADRARPAKPPSSGADDLFVGWLRGVFDKDETGQLGRAFRGNTLSRNVNVVDQLFEDVDVPAGAKNSSWKEPATSEEAAKQLFAHLNFSLEPDCIDHQDNYYYRKYDGSCNWLKQGEANIGALGTQKTRDYNQTYYADGISKPRDGPNARAVSNAFFKRKQALYYEHTPLLLGLIEFIMHDVTYSEDSKTEFINVEVPEDEDHFEQGTTFQVWRTLPVNGTGTSKENPREITNQATTWLDLSALYGSTEDVAKKLRSFKGGKLLAHKARPEGTHRPAEYLPFNTMQVPTRTRPHVKVESLFAGGDPRTNEDWMMLGVHTLLLREHNRLCDVLAKQHRDWDDEKIFQTIRLVMSAKYELIANSYQMAYWTEDMPWPRDDGFPLFRQMYGESSMDINPFNSYPWPLVTKGGKPMVVSVEMSVLYRFHEFIISEFPIIDAASEVLWTQDLFQTGFNATGFVETGLENILRGTVGTNIPNFKSGVDENFRSAGKYRGKPFDIVTWSIIHEREQGLPTFNDYFREYNKQDPEVEVPIRKTFEDFTSDKEMLKNLKDLYNSPDEVDMTVGVQLDEEYFPGTTVPKSALIVSLFSLFGMGNSDRFSIGYAMTRCMLVDQPWDCHPSNALEELLWKRDPDHPEHPDFRLLDPFWLKEIDLPANGANLLWRLVTENTEIKCLQQRPLFPVDEETNPVLCSLPQRFTDPKPLSLLAMALQFMKAYVVDNMKRHYLEILIGFVTLAAFIRAWSLYSRQSFPPVLRKHPLLGRAKTFQTNPVRVLEDGLKKYPDQVFGIKLATRKHFLLTRPDDMEVLRGDNDLEIKFDLKAFMESINFPLITKRINFDTDMHTKMVKHNLQEPEQVAAYHQVLEDAAEAFINRNPLCNDGRPTKKADLNGYLLDYITFVFSRFIVGPVGFDNNELLETFKKFNKDATKAMTFSAMLPGPLKYIAAWGIRRDFGIIWKHLKPVIRDRRASLAEDGGASSKGVPPVLMDEIIKELEDDNRVSDVVALLVFGGLANLQATFTSTFMDIINEPGLQKKLLESLYAATSSNLNPFRQTPEWKSLRSATFESIRLAGPATGPARVMLKNVRYPSDPTRTLPKGKVATLSARITHRDPKMWGQDAAVYNSDRFLETDPPIGDVKYITWGLTGPHMCPGRWIALSSIQIMCKSLLERYHFAQDYVLVDEEKYHYPDPGNVERWPVEVTVSLRATHEL